MLREKQLVSHPNIPVFQNHYHEEKIFSEKHTTAAILYVSSNEYNGAYFR